MALRSALDLYRPRGNRIVTDPEVEPVSVPEMKEHLRISVDNTDDDKFLTDAITESRQEIEDITGLAFVTQTWILTLDQWPSQREPWWDGVRQGAITELHAMDGVMELPRYPLQSVPSANVYDDEGIATAGVVADVFDVDAQQMPGRMALKSGATWPIATREINAVDVTYIAGYGNANTDVPAPLRRAVRNMVAYVYAHRGDGCDMGDAYHKSGAATIAGRYRVVKI